MPLVKGFVLNAKKFRAKPAFIDRSANRIISYSDLLTASLLLSEEFHQMIREKYIGIMLPTSAACGISVLGSLMAGKIPVMINYSTGAENNAGYARNKCGFENIITSRAFLKKIEFKTSEGLFYLEDILNGPSLLKKARAFLLSRMPARFIFRKIHTGSEDDFAVVLFTSGSEKEPKAVPLTHGNILSNIQAFGNVINFSTDDRMLASLPYFHVFGFNVNLWTPLIFGMTIISCANPLDYKTVCESIREEKPTILAGTPAFLRGYLKKSSPGDFRSLRITVSGSDKCPGSLRHEFLQKQGITLLEGYGATETSPVISVNTPLANRPGSTGKPLPNLQIKIVDHETGTPCECGKTGRVLVKGPSVMNGYLDKTPGENPAEGWYDTGDMGYLDKEGYLWHEGRLKRFAKIGGEMVSLLNVEEVLKECLPEETSCCAIEIPDPLKGGRIAAITSCSVEEKEILNKMGQKLPNIALPKHFLRIDEFPRTGAGKPDLKKISEIAKRLIQS